MEYKYTELEEYQSLFSDLYKDVNGFRPRWATSEQFNSVEWLKAQCKSLGEELTIVIAREREEEQKRIQEFENTVSEVINSGAGSRAIALRWLFDAEEDEYKKNDRDYYCFTYGLPYGYFKGEVF